MQVTKRFLQYHSFANTFDQNEGLLGSTVYIVICPMLQIRICESEITPFDIKKIGVMIYLAVNVYSFFTLTFIIIIIIILSYYPQHSNFRHCFLLDRKTNQIVNS